MRLKRYVSPSLIQLDVDVQSKDELLHLIASRMASVSSTMDTERLEKALLEREGLGGTAVGHGVALPHARVPDGKDALVGLVRLAQPLDFNAPDGEAVWLAAFSALDAAESHRHMQVLARLARTFMSQANRDALKQARTPEEALEILLHDDEPGGR